MDKKLLPGSRKKAFLITVAGGMAAAGYELVIRPWHLRWGATDEEARRSLPGDDLVSHAQLSATHAITIQAPVEGVWPWIVQIGQGRGGFYSYDWLENLLGMDIHNTNRILPELQQLRVGDIVPFWKRAGVTVTAIVPQRALVLAGQLYSSNRKPGGPPSPNGSTGGSWAFFLEEQGDAITRLILRTRAASFQPTWLSSLFYHLLLEPAHFAMERKMLLGIKARAEALADSERAETGALSKHPKFELTRATGRRNPGAEISFWHRMRGLNQKMAHNYTRGFGPRGLVLLLTTTGRKSGLPRVTPLQYEEQDGAIYVASARGQAADWFRNLLVNSQVRVQIRDKQFEAEAEPITDPARIADFLEMRLRSHPVMMRLMLAAEGLPPWAGRSRLEEFAREKAVVAIHPCH